MQAGLLEIYQAIKELADRVTAMEKALADKPAQPAQDDEPELPAAVARMYQRIEQIEERENALPAWACNPPRLALMRDVDDD